jgi:hypothetical protein
VRECACGVAKGQLPVWAFADRVMIQSWKFETVVLAQARERGMDAMDSIARLVRAAVPPLIALSVALAEVSPESSNGV